MCNPIALASFPSRATQTQRSSPKCARWLQSFARTLVAGEGGLRRAPKRANAAVRTPTPHRAANSAEGWGLAACYKLQGVTAGVSAIPVCVLVRARPHCTRFARRKSLRFRDCQSSPLILLQVAFHTFCVKPFIVCPFKKTFRCSISKCKCFFAGLP